MLLPCQAGSTVARLQHDTSTTCFWFQTSNLIQSNRTAFAENKTQKHSTTFETKSSYCRVARQGLPCYTAVARLGFKRRATAVLKSNTIRAIEFGTAVARRSSTEQATAKVLVSKYNLKKTKMDHYFWNKSDAERRFNFLKI